ncbi:protein kinase [Sorangium cellulosum]|uniref:Protein kinase n=1 Tax=Sorangium cellulosum TaxID=56 RepID=A0A2L0EXL8_SORCE|nr:serine/threonine-protein kinase [Sorangium cellulosum]AUX43989.1 protein kinase [Sorangium cellulosum]
MTPAQIGPYRILGQLGQGGMGIVYWAEHVQTGEKVAVKTARVPYGCGVAGLRCEIDALTRVRHPGIVRILDEGIEEGLPWYAMERLVGRTLDDHHRALWALAPRPEAPDAAAALPTVPAEPAADSPRRPLDASTHRLDHEMPRDAQATLPLGTPGHTTRQRPARKDDGAPSEQARSSRWRYPAAGGKLAEALALIREVCEPLSFLHGAGIVHRDLKPANIFIRESGAPVLVDFGLVFRCAGAVGREVIDVAGPVIGTVTYMSPEQIRGQILDARSDLYALGCILYEVVASRPPFINSSRNGVLLEHLTMTPVPPSMLVDGVPPELDALVLHLLEKEPRHRLGHADDVAQRLGQILGAPPVSPRRGEAPRACLYRPGLAGRQEVLGVFCEHIARALRGHGRCVLVGGESGVGKTYLAAAIAREASLRGMRVIAGECVPFATVDARAGRDARAAPLHPFRRLFEVVADLCREGGEELTEVLLGGRAKVLAAYEPLLRHVPGHEAQPEPPEVPAEAARLRLLNALGETLAALAEDQPLLLILDDLQWADELSLSFLGSLGASYFDGRPLLLLGTYRAEEVGDGLGEVIAGDGVERVQLGRLDEGTIGVLVGDMLGMPRPPEALVRLLARRSSGNPFFAAEYLRAAVAEGLLRREHGAFRLTVAAETAHDIEHAEHALPLPGSLRELVGRRLAGLSEAARGLVDVAAVLGREVDGEILAAVAGLSQREALPLVKELLNRQVIEEPQAGRFRFVHDKLREFAYERVGEARRAALHRAAALAIEARFAGDQGFSLLYSELAHHFTAARELPKAIEYLEKAGVLAQRTFANREVVRCFTEALSLDDQSARRVDPLRRATWERQLGNAHLGLGQLVESQAHLLRAVALLDEPMPARAWHLALSFAGQVLTQVRHRVAPPRPAGLAPEGRAVLLEAARAYDLLVPVSYYVTGDLLRILYATLANLNLAERAGPSPELGLAYGSAHLTVGLIPWFSLAETYGRKAHEVLAGVADPAVRSWVYVLAGGYASGVGRWDVAFDLGAKALEMAKELGFPRRIEEAQGVIGTARCLHGDFALARDMSQRTYDSGRRGDPQTQVWGAAGVAQACLHLGQWERALAAAQEAEALLSQKLGRPEQIIALGVLSLAHLRGGDARRARAAAERGLAVICEGKPISFYCIIAYNCVAEVFLELWEGAAAGERAALARGAERACVEVERSAQVFPVQRPRAFWLRGQYEALSGRTRRARRLWERSVEAARRLDLAYDEGIAELALARSMARGEPARLARARRAAELLSRGRAAPELAEFAEEMGLNDRRIETA